MSEDVVEAEVGEVEVDEVSQAAFWSCFYRDLFSCLYSISVGLK